MYGTCAQLFHELNIFHLEDVISILLQFQAIMDQLFQTFNNISVANFAELSGCVFSWLEEHCKPQVSLLLFKLLHTFFLVIRQTGFNKYVTNVSDFARSGTLGTSAA